MKTKILLTALFLFIWALTYIFQFYILASYKKEEVCYNYLWEEHCFSQFNNPLLSPQRNITIKEEIKEDNIFIPPKEVLIDLWIHKVTHYFTPSESEKQWDSCWWWRYLINYSWDCRITASWHYLTRLEAHRVVACDPSIPFWTRLRIEWMENDVWCRDRWWAIKWKRIDWWRWYWKEAEVLAHWFFDARVWIVQAPRKIDKIIIHHTVSEQTWSFQQLIDWINANHRYRLHRIPNWFQKHIAYHYIIWKNWEIINTRPEWEIWFHTATWSINISSIWISFAWNFDKYEPTELAIQRWKLLIEELENRYWELEILWHKDINNTACPWRYFDLSRLK